MDNSNDNILGKPVVIVYEDYDEPGNYRTILGTVKAIDEFTITVQDDYGNTVIIGKRAILKVKRKNGVGRHE